MFQKKILVLLGPSVTDLKSIHYALSLAERLKAQVYIFQAMAIAGIQDSLSLWQRETLSDLITSARQAGFTVSHHITDGEIKEELIGLVKTENIDFIVFGAEDKVYERLLHQLKSLVMAQIIQVKEKHQIHYL